jgi:hypothetical protein
VRAKRPGPGLRGDGIHASCPGGYQRGFAAACLAIAVALPVFSSTAAADPSDIPPWEEGYARDAFLQRRLSYVLDGLRFTARSDPALKDVLDRIRLRTPTKSLEEAFPNAYAIPGANTKFILIESRFAGQIAALSAAGAYLTMMGATGEGPICRQLLLAASEAKDRGTQPVFTIQLAKFPESADPPTRRGLEKLMGLISDEVLLWFLLHETGHQALGHKPKPLDRKPESRAQEAEADRWASQTMTRLGFGLFGTHRYLVGRATVDRCLAGFGYAQDEKQSTHPSWLQRADTMRSEFGVIRTGPGFPRAIFVPAKPVDYWFHIARPGDDAQTYVTEMGQGPVRAASEWQGNSVTIYSRTKALGRIEIRLPDALLGVLPIAVTEFDAANQRIGSVSLFAIQANPAFIDWMEVSPGVRIGDVRRADKDEGFKTRLRAVGASDTAINQIMPAFRQYEQAEAAIVVGFMKGQIPPDQLESRFSPVTAAYKTKLLAVLGAERYARLRQIVESDPNIKWAPGQDAAHYRKLEEQLFQYNFDRKD